MNIQDLINNAQKDKNMLALEIFNNILNISKQYNVSINNAVTYLLLKEEEKYTKKILNICRAIYPYDSSFSLNFFRNTSEFSLPSTINISKPTVKPTEKEKIGCNINDVKKKRKPKLKESTTIETDVGKLEIG